MTDEEVALRARIGRLRNLLVIRQQAHDEDQEIFANLLPEYRRRLYRWRRNGFAAEMVAIRKEIEMIEVKLTCFTGP